MSFTDRLEAALHVSDEALRVWLVNQLVGMGFSPVRLHFFATAAALRTALNELRPHLLIAEQGGTTGSGAELIRKLKQLDRGQRNPIGVLIAKDLIEARNAHRAGRDVDLVLMNPTPEEDFRALILRLVLQRDKGAQEKKESRIGVPISNSDSGRATSIRVAERSVAEAVEKFDHARSLSYGLTQRHQSRERILAAFESLIAEQRWEEAYAISKRALPVLPELQARLPEVLRLAFANRKIGDLDELYRLYTTIERRSESMNRAMAAALVVSARHYLRLNQPQEAEDAYRKAIISSGSRLWILREAISRMLGCGRIDAAKSFFNRFPSEALKGRDYLVLEAWLLEADGQDETAILKGRTAYRSGIRDADLSLSLARALARRGKTDFAEDLALEARRLWPERADEFAPFVRAWIAEALTLRGTPEKPAG